MTLQLPLTTVVSEVLSSRFVSIRVDGMSMLVGFELDHGEHRRRMRLGVGAVTSTELLHGLWLLPSGVPVPAGCIPQVKIERLRAAVHSVAETCHGFERLYSPAGRVQSVAFVGRNPDEMVHRAIRFTPIFQRFAIVVGGAIPLPSKAVRAAREWEVGVIEVTDESARLVVEAGEPVAGVPSVYRWWMAELAYQSWLYENTQLVS